MSVLNIVDSPTDLFTFDKKIITFEINTNTNNSISSNGNQNQKKIHNPMKIGSSTLNIKNISSEYLLLNIKTTKKQYYLVTPSLFILPPNGEQKIDFNYYIEENKNITNEGHKFKFIGFIIQKNEKDQKPKVLLNEYMEKKIEVRGTQIKLGVNFIENDINNSQIIQKTARGGGKFLYLTEDSNNSILSKENMTMIQKNKILAKSEFDNKISTPKIKSRHRSSKRLMDNVPKDKTENITDLNKLKVEYYKLKNECDILESNYYNLENHVDLEENNQENFKEEEPNNNNYYPNNSKQIKLSQSVCIVFLFFGVLLGFYLS